MNTMNAQTILDAIIIELDIPSDSSVRTRCMHHDGNSEPCYINAWIAVGAAAVEITVTVWSDIDQMTARFVRHERRFGLVQETGIRTIDRNLSRLLHKGSITDIDTRMGVDNVYSDYAPVG